MACSRPFMYSVMLFMPSGLSTAIAMSALKRCAMTFRNCWIMTVISTVLPEPLEPTMPSIGFLVSTKSMEQPRVALRAGTSPGLAVAVAALGDALADPWPVRAGR